MKIVGRPVVLVGERELAEESELDALVDLIANPVPSDPVDRMLYESRVESGWTFDSESKVMLLKSTIRQREEKRRREAIAAERRRRMALVPHFGDHIKVVSPFGPDLYWVWVTYPSGDELAGSMSIEEMKQYDAWFRSEVLPVNWANEGF